MSLGRSITTVGGFTLLSRILGFVRDIVLSAVLGSGPVADAFIVAFKLPNLFRRLFAEGAFSAAFVPLFARELQGHGRDAALAFARQAHACLLLILIPFAALLVLAMPVVISLLAPGLSDDRATFDLAVQFSRITFPYLIFISLASLYGGVLNSIDRFAEVAVTPVLLNIALIGAVLGLTPFLPNSGYAASIGVALAGLLQWLWLLLSCRRDGVGMKLVRPRYTERVAHLVKLATPVAIGGGAQQISVMLDVIWASLLPTGSISALYYADRIAQLPLGVVGIAIGTALLPLLARQLRAGQAEAAMANQNRAIEFGLLFSLPSALALWLLAEPMIRVLFEHGRFGPADTMRASGALAAFALGLPPFVLVKALTPGFFAREDTRTPLHIAIACIVANVAMNAAFIYGTSLAQVGIALASSLSGWLNAALLAAVLLRRHQWVPDKRLVSRFIRALIATAGMGVVLCGVLIALERPLSHPDLEGVAALVGLCVAGALAYAGLAIALGVLRLADLRFLRRPPSGATPPPAGPA
ncbi:murein biosynthesis integral membrane protein MurJ [Enhydrobacter sp.]|jgi:putative peptidoglycan lipid II flippase|uniref:murein biosynthesis integral membrane protein MurJ n=1 Tax=Enhydrobacter sp. TaxID=1894999 RepID=UPI002627AE14|nr:murein biosynthesis integral membrane protein MurJ [Enhydrobacter sp.]WIM10865.1 MAG: Peptidoglycan lipid II flippase MurJ [Enhydrobacter sp.]